MQGSGGLIEAIVDTVHLWIIVNMLTKNSNFTEDTGLHTVALDPFPNGPQNLYKHKMLIRWKY